MSKYILFPILLLCQFAAASTYVANYYCVMTNNESGEVLAAENLKAKKAHEGVAYSQSLKAKENGFRYDFGYSAILNEGKVQAVIFDFVSRKNGEIIERRSGGLGEDQDQSTYTLKTNDVSIICDRESL